MSPFMNNSYEDPGSLQLKTTNFIGMAASCVSVLLLRRI